MYKLAFHLPIRLLWIWLYVSISKCLVIPWCAQKVPDPLGLRFSILAASWGHLDSYLKYLGMGSWLRSRPLPGSSWGGLPLSKTMALNPGCMLESSGIFLKDHAQGWALPEILKPIHWAEGIHSNNWHSSFLSRDEKDIAMHCSREISISLTFKIFNYFIHFDLPSIGTIALSSY